jgi:hypothetical protein
MRTVCAFSTRCSSDNLRRTTAGARWHRRAGRPPTYQRSSRRSDPHTARTCAGTPVTSTPDQAYPPQIAPNANLI